MKNHESKMSLPKEETQTIISICTPLYLEILLLYSHIKMEKLFSSRAEKLLLKKKWVRAEEKKYDENVCLKDGKKKQEKISMLVTWLGGGHQA